MGLYTSCQTMPNTLQNRIQILMCLMCMVSFGHTEAAGNLHLFEDSSVDILSPDEIVDETTSFAESFLQERTNSDESADTTTLAVIIEVVDPPAGEIGDITKKMSKPI